MKLARSSTWYKSHPEKAKEQFKRKNLLKNYGITLEEYERKRLEQSDLCAICKKPETATIKGKIKELSVDHNHETKQIRGLLCSDCNRALGMFKEDILVLESAIKYLKDYSALSK